MNNLKQLETREVNVGENIFYIRPLPAFKAANMTGELAAYLSDMTPVSLAEKIRLVYEHPPVITPEMYQKFEQQTIVSQYCDLIQPVPSTHA